MDSKRAVGAAILGIVALVIIWGLLSYLPQRTSAPRGANSVAMPDKTATTVEKKGQHIVVHHRIHAGMHIYDGTVDLPSSCSTLEVKTKISYAPVTKVYLSLTSKQGAEVCAQIITPQSFSTSVTSATVPVVEVDINGEKAEVELIEAK